MIGLPAQFVHLLFPLIKQIPIMFVYPPISHIVTCVMKIHSIPQLQGKLDGSKVFFISFASDWLRNGHVTQFEPVRHEKFAEVFWNSFSSFFWEHLRKQSLSPTLSHISSQYCYSILWGWNCSKHIVTGLMMQPAHREGKMDIAILWKLFYFRIFCYMIQSVSLLFKPFWVCFSFRVV